MTTPIIPLTAEQISELRNGGFVRLTFKDDDFYLGYEGKVDADLIITEDGSRTIGDAAKPEDIRR